MRHPILDYRQIGRMNIGIWPSLCTIQSVTITLSESNQPIITGLSDIPGMKNIPCILGPLWSLRITDVEVRTSAVQSEVRRRICKLSSIFTNIIGSNQAVVDGNSYRVVGIEHDYLNYSTRLSLEVINP